MLRNTHPYFVLNGNASEAIDFYSTVLDAKVLDITRFGDMPEDPDFEVSEEVKQLVMNASIELPNGDVFMFSDTMPGMPFALGDQLTLALVFDTVEETRRVFEQLAEGGQVTMELQETFWSPLYGNVTDQFGNQWQVDTLSEDA